MANHSGHTTTSPAPTPHVAALAQRHAALEAELSAIQSRPRADEVEMTRIKREKLRLKDRMARG